MSTSSNQAIAESLRLSKAMVLARQQQWRAAEAVLCEGGQWPADVIGLHALAALLTAEGSYLRALKVWEELLRREAGHAEARRMIAELELWISRPSWARYFPIMAGTLAAIVLALFLYLALASPVSEPRPPASAVEPALATTDPVAALPETAAPSPTPAPVVSFPVAKPARRHAH